MKEKMKDGDEEDAIFARRVYKYLTRAGVAKKIKKRLHKRRRREFKLEDKHDL